MAGYVKIWTTVRHNEDFLSLSGLERSVYLQLLIWCKDQRDDGQVIAKSVSEFARTMSISRPSFERIVQKMTTIRLIEVSKNSNGVITINIPNYKRWQGLTAKEVVKKGRTRCKKRATTKPDQTRLNQTRPDHLLSPVKSSDHKQAIEYWCQKYLERFQVKYDFRAGKDGMAVKRLLATFGLEVFCQIIDRMFISDDPFYRTGGGRTLTVLSANANKLAQELAQQNSFLDKLSDAGRATYLAGQEAIRARKQRRKDSPTSDGV